MLKKLFIGLFLSLLFLGSAGAVSAQENNANIYLFHSKTCPHCKEEIAFLGKLKASYPEIEVVDFEISNQGNVLIMKRVGRELGINVGGVPLTIIGEEVINGFLDEKTTGAQIEAAVKTCLSDGCEDLVAPLLPGSTKKKEKQKKAIIPENLAVPEDIKLPILGTIKVRDASLPAFTFAIAALDGFNPRAMWTLMFLITLLLGMENKKRMWILGSAFIVASGVMYFAFMAAWLNLFLFLGLVLWIRVAVGIVALIAGGWNLREWWKNRDGACKVEGSEKKQATFAKLKKITEKKNFWFALAGIVMLAVAVNMVELVCSAGLPAIYTQVLALNNLATWQYYGYLLFYILIFMLDDLIVFVVAMLTLKAIGVDSKYGRVSTLIGGLGMLAIGLLLIFKPEILMFAGG